MKFDKELANKYFNDLLKKYKIKVCGYSVTSSGWANIKKKEIKIPQPTNLDRFGVCLHEIKHIIDGDRGKRYEQEFYCDLFALDIFKELGYETEKWEQRMRWHSLSRIAMAINRGLNIRNINEEIISFFNEVNFSTWYGRKVFVRHSKNEKLGYIIELVQNLNKDEVEGLLNRKGLMLRKSEASDSTFGRWIVTGNGEWYGPDYGNLSEIIEEYKLSY